ncbi:hypothetical protein AYO20_06268 [Fonsecaea nubica]|uniref:Uncharacterized protein n=1 Tax=Fonsecaea nubica TaxID=856822 RepID=A0A178CZV2_9EURO|nr:hypothetical protein AYO20_06268 [Fonsecaea nubica]OAL34425.1 hypothetical protein AYO20_06268 [Fonsecaea nubica]
MAEGQVQVQGVTTTTKKRGRPAKKQSLDDEGVVLLQQRESKTDGAEIEMVQALKPKSRGRPSSSAATTASKTSSLAASARSGRAKQVPTTATAGAGAGGAAVEEEVVGTVSSGRGSASAKRKPSATAAAAAGVKTPDAAPSKARKSPAAKVSSSQPDTASSTSTSGLATVTTTTVAEKKTKAKAAAKKAETEISSQKTSQQPGTPRLSTSTLTSKILGHAKAFSEKSSQLQRDILQLVNEREARHLSSRDIEAEILEISSSIRSEADAISPVPAPAPALETISTGHRDSIGGTSSMLTTASAASNMYHNTTLTSDAAHVFPTQTIASFSQQQPQHFYPPPSVLSSPVATPQTQHQVRGYSSTKALPMSTTIALAARQQNNPNPSGGSRPSMPPRPTIPPEVPNAPKLTELPLEQLKKDPRYRKASTRYTTFVVALPFAIVSSYFLWERCKCPPPLLLSWFMA